MSRHRGLEQRRGKGKNKGEQKEDERGEGKKRAEERKEN